MIYSDVIAAGWHNILKPKQKYVTGDVRRVMAKLPQLMPNQARFVVVCTAAYYDTEVTRPVGKRWN